MLLLQTTLYATAANARTVEGAGFPRHQCFEDSTDVLQQTSQRATAT